TRTIIDSEVHYRIERGDSGRIGKRLHVATVQPRNGGAFGAVYLERHQIVAPYPRRPRGDDGAGRAGRQLDQGGCLVFHIDGVARAGFIGPLRHRSRSRCDDATNRPEYVFDQVTKVRIHIEQKAATPGLTVVPAWPLAWLIEAVEHPPAKLQAK